MAVADLRTLITIFEAARTLVARLDNDFLMSSWRGTQDAVEELDQILSALRSGVVPPRENLSVLFAPTGPLQEVSMRSGWADEFEALARQFDAATSPR